KIIYESEKLEIVTMSWNTGDYTSIHDHGQAQWGLVLSFGAVQNTVFDIIDNELILIEEQILNAGETTILDNSAIHQMGNSNFRPSISLHIYYSKKTEKGVTAEARNYDLYENKIYIANGGAFLLLSKENIVSEEKCPNYDQSLYEKQFTIRRNFLDKCCPVNMRKNYQSSQINSHYE
ncbi:MAG: cysteine dioxygenase family protein, partial [Bacteroidales bacterium]|nr:cysteine dioxygenase family protein [Bacteroidales bacterium]